MGDNKKIKMTTKEKYIISFICVVFAIYLGITIFFRTHFYNTTIDGINMFGESIEDVKDIISYKLDNYCLKVNEEGQKTQYIIGKDINFKYDLGEQVENIKHKESPFWCIAVMLKHSEYETNNVVTLDKNLIEKEVENIIASRNKNIKENVNPKIEYKDGKYVIIEESYGNIIDKKKMVKKLIGYIENIDYEINIEDLDCYTKPQYTSKSKEVIKAKETLDKYVSTAVTYCFNDTKEVLNKDKIHDWLKVNDKYEVYVEEEKVKEYIKNLANAYNTVGKEREFTTSSKNKIKVSRGSYGFIIDEDFEAALLVDAIKNGKIISKEPEYSQKELVYDKDGIGNTYVEIDLSKQHLWFYKSGKLITEGDIVSGNVNNDCATPSGIYSLVYKQKDTILRGPGYASPVNFWMPFNGGIGIHDASWRYTFGGSIYISNGSHGCINAPYDLANTVYNNIDSGTPIVCYY